MGPRCGIPPLGSYKSPYAQDSIWDGLFLSASSQTGFSSLHGSTKQQNFDAIGGSISNSFLFAGFTKK